MPAVTVNGLQKSYASFEALRGISFEIAEGEVFGLLGPNGAGKTTTVEILEGYRRRDAGDVSVLGVDPEREGSGWRNRLGIVLQSSAMYPNLTVAEHVRLFAGYYSAPRNVDEVVTLVGLDEKRNARVKTLSGGQRRRLDLALGLIGDPEPLPRRADHWLRPRARRAAWEMIRSLRALEDGAAHDALPRRSRAARRPSGRFARARRSWAHRPSSSQVSTRARFAIARAQRGVISTRSPRASPRATVGHSRRAAHFEDLHAGTVARRHLPVAHRGRGGHE
jgi:ABC-type ATPase involved in cell division